MALTQKEKMERYADVPIRVGLDFRSGQALMIAGAELDSAEVVRTVERAAYGAGASRVETFW